MAHPSLVPLPVRVTWSDASFTLAPDAAVSATPAHQRIVRRVLGLIDAPAGDPVVSVETDESLAEEGYRLTVTPDGVRIVVASDAGLHWACQTLRQLQPAERFGAPLTSAVEVRCAEIEDEPRFSWRGAHLDVSRHFMPFDALLRFVEQLAAHKYNRFHLHICDDHGWRFESKRFPKLNEIAAWRPETVHPQYGTDRTPHGGLYTQDQLRRLVEHAAGLGMTVVPEFDFPGHATAALAAYPEHSVPGFEVPTAITHYGVLDNVLNLSDASVQFVLDILDEALEIFPSPWIHIGGDEVPRRQWRDSEAGRARAGELGVEVEGLQGWFTEQVVAFLRERGRIPIGWDEVVEHGPIEGLICHAWREAKLALPAAQAGYDVIVAPVSHTYFDYYPSEDADEVYCIGGLTPTEKVYGFEPTDGFGDAAEHVLGTQFQLWTEYVYSFPRVEYLSWPRGCALAEVAWSPRDARDWSDFSQRLADHVRRLDVLGINYRPEEGPRPWQRGGRGRLERRR